MSGVWGNKIEISIFGESHGKGVGIVLSGLPAGITIDSDMVTLEMKRRAPGRDPLSTPRKESDSFEIISGIFDDKLTGAPLCCMIMNTNTRSGDYSEFSHKFRPGHADYTAHVKYNGFHDYRGGGHFSGRLTAPLVFAGAICKQVLQSMLPNIKIGAHIYKITDIKDDPFDLTSSDTLQPLGKSSQSDIEFNLSSLEGKPFPVINDTAAKAMKAAIEEARENGDSVGGVIECAAINIPAGIGDPFFDSLESTLAHLIFSIPAVKGLEFGKGFELSNMPGSEANDDFYFSDDLKIETYTNNNGGINGGISNGMPITFKAAIKPTPSISKVQKTVDMETEKDAEICIQGRHDPCIVHRAVPVIEAVTAIGILSLIL